MRLIDADELIKSIDYSADLGGALGKVVEVVKNYAKYMVQTAPTIKEQKTGKWIGDKCSVCGKGIDDLIESSEWYQNESPRYCPFCGIKIQPSKAESEE